MRDEGTPGKLYTLEYVKSKFNGTSIALHWQSDQMIQIVLVSDLTHIVFTAGTKVAVHKTGVVLLAALHSTISYPNLASSDPDGAALDPIFKKK